MHQKVVDKHKQPIRLLTLLGFLVLLLSACSQQRVIPKHLQIAEEYVFPDEQATEEELVKVLEGLVKDRSTNGQFQRDAHPKSHGCMKASFAINENLPEELKVGVFDQERTYPAYVRFSTGSGRVESDTKKEFLGLGIKLMNVDGEKLIANEKHTQDFLLISTNVEAVRTSKEFLKIVQASVSGSPMSYFFNPSDLHIKEFMQVLASKKHHPTPLEIRYWSTTPYLFAEGNAVKYSVQSCGPTTRELPEELTDNYLREVMVEQLKSGDACFDFMVQFQKDPYNQPIEDAFIEWDEEQTSFIKVAKLTIPSQDFDTPEKNTFCENLSFNPWHARIEHRPLGNMNRARKVVYDHISKVRHDMNGIERIEPTGDEVFVGQVASSPK